MLNRLRRRRGERPETTLDRGRLLGLFRPYRRRLGAVLALIAVSAGLGMVSPFLLRAVLDDAIPARDTTLLAALVVGMIAIAIATGALGVAQTLLSNTVGQRVMHDLRAAVYRHLQRLSLSFFTRTRTGEIQSRIANDIGGVQNVVTSTATSIVSNVTTVIAAGAAMFLLDWRLALFAFALLPFFVWLTRRVGAERKRITGVRQGRLADMSALVEESLSVSGMLLGRTMGRQGALAERFERESAELADIEVQSRMAGRWRMASVQIAFAGMPALVYLFGGLSMAGGGAAISIGTLVAFTTLQTRLFFPVQSLLSVGVEVQSSLALFERVFEYLDLPIDVAERDGALELPAEEIEGDVSFEHVGFRYESNGEPTLRAIDLRVPAGTTLALVGETGSGKTTLAYLLPMPTRSPCSTAERSWSSAPTRSSWRATGATRRSWPGSGGRTRCLRSDAAVGSLRRKRPQLAMPAFPCPARSHGPPPPCGPSGCGAAPRSPHASTPVSAAPAVPSGSSAGL